MEEQDWKDIIEELTQQIQGISIERAQARANVKKAAKIIKEYEEELLALRAKAPNAVGE